VVRRVVFVAALVLAVFAGRLDAAQDEDIMRSQLESLDLSGVDDVIKQSGNPSLKGVSLKDMIERAMNGEMDLSPGGIMNAAIDGLFGEFYALAPLMRNMLAVTIVSAVLFTLSSSLGRNGAGDAGFFICYLTVAALLTVSFNICADIMTGLLNDLCGVAQASLPALLTLMAMSGGAASAYALSPASAFIIGALSSFIRDFISPLLILGATTKLVSQISERDTLHNLSELIKNCAGWSLKGVTALFRREHALERAVPGGIAHLREQRQFERDPGDPPDPGREPVGQRPA
jgi:stage III sporulation protein AE